MWRNYSADYIKRNRASGISIMAAALIASLFLSLLSTLFFNAWTYEIHRVVSEEGDWQGRLTGRITEDDLAVIESFTNVKVAVINRELSEEQTVVVDVYFRNMRTIYQDMPLLTSKLGLEDNAAAYHEQLLSGYLIHDPQDKEPPRLLAYYLVILVLVSLSLIYIIHNAFVLTMNGRLHQFGILSSIGATPRQLRTCLMQEAAVLSVGPILVGSFLGIALSFGTLQVVNKIGEGVAERQDAVFDYHPLVLVVTILASMVTVLLSAWLPARKLGKLTPLQAIRNTEGLGLKKKKRSPVLSLLFGTEGELAGNALKAQKKALRTSTFSLTLSFLAFTIMMCFLTLSAISRYHTYFERYQKAWDVMVTVKNDGIENFRQSEDIRKLSGVRSAVVYQKATASVSVSEANISDELKELGGPAAVAGSSVTREGETFILGAPIIIMDDQGFMEYCEQIGVMPKLSGSIVLNRIWDSVNSNFRYKEYIPIMKEGQATISLHRKDEPESRMELPVLAYTQITPVLREEYDNYTLVQLVPLSLWKQISGQLGNREEDTYIRILGEEGITLDKLSEMESALLQTLSKEYTVEIENRIQEKLNNDEVNNGFMLLLGGLCSLLAIIGIANVFSNTLGFYRHRKREFARYLSLGMTPGNMRKMFAIEALVIAGRPLLITLPLTVVGVGFMITASYLDPMEFLAKAPTIPILVFLLAILAFVGVAYYIGGRRILRSNLIESLRNDIMT